MFLNVGKCIRNISVFIQTRQTCDFRGKSALCCHLATAYVYYYWLLFLAKGSHKPKQRHVDGCKVQSTSQAPDENFYLSAAEMAKVSLDT